MSDSLDLPPGFRWGTATAAHQVEGNNVNSDFWVLEHQPGGFFAEPSGDAIDHYHRYRSDLELLAELGFDAYRFSIEWARIEPAPGEFSMAAIDHYRRVLECCHEFGLQPTITLQHFTSPRWLIEMGGWAEPATAARFADYCAYTIRGLGDLVDLCCTINEANVPHLIERYWSLKSAEYETDSPLRETLAAPFGIDPRRFAPMMFLGDDAVICDAHKQATLAVKSERDLPVGWSLALHDLQADPGGEATRDAVRARTQTPFLEASQGDDFVGVQTYTRERYGPEGPLPHDSDRRLTQQYIEFYPEALEASVRHAAAVTGVPVVVTENGIATADDNERIEYHWTALNGLQRCLDDGIDVGGYFAWSSFDNFEWMFGYHMTFGLIAVDRATQTRTVKPSGRWLGTLRNGG